MSNATLRNLNQDLREEAKSGEFNLLANQAGEQKLKKSGVKSTLLFTTYMNFRPGSWLQVMKLQTGLQRWQMVNSKVLVIEPYRIKRERLVSHQLSRQIG